MRMRSAYCNELLMVRLSGSFMSLSKRYSFVLSLKDIVNIIFGFDDSVTVGSSCILSNYSKDVFSFKGKETGSEIIRDGWCMRCVRES